MSALNAYLSEVRRQRELLEEAHERDGLAEEFCIDGAPPGIRRRIWTRQDRNRVFFKPRFLPSLVAQQQLPNYRASTRLERIVSRLRRRGIDGWHRAAMAEAGANGTFPVVAERLAAVSAIHQMLVNAYDEHLPEDWNGDWAGLQERHQRAVDELSMFVTGGSEPPVTPQKSVNERPNWDAVNGRLTFSGELAREVIGHAKRVRAILDAFQEEGWPYRIDDPLPPGCLKNALVSINDGLEFLEFRKDGTGEGILWKRTQPELNQNST